MLQKGAEIVMGCYFIVVKRINSVDARALIVEGNKCLGKKENYNLGISIK